jgi:hypothetical protein
LPFAVGNKDVSQEKARYCKKRFPNILDRKNRAHIITLRSREQGFLARKNCKSSAERNSQEIAKRDFRNALDKRNRAHIITLRSREQGFLARKNCKSSAERNSQEIAKKRFPKSP